jgi:hypothetical protein
MGVIAQRTGLVEGKLVAPHEVVNHGPREFGNGLEAHQVANGHGSLGEHEKAIDESLPG